MPSPFENNMPAAIILAQKGDRKAMEYCLKVLERPLLNLVHRYAKFNDRVDSPVSKQDLYNEAILHTIENMHRFKPNTDLPDQSIRHQFARYFVDHARPCLREKCQQAIRTIDMPEWATKYAQRINRAIRDLEKKDGVFFNLHPPDAHKVAALSGAPLSKVKLYLKKGFYLEPSQQFVEVTAPDGSWDGKQYLTRDPIYSDEGGLEQATISDETKRILAHAWKSLSSRQKQVLAMRFGFGCDACTRRTIAESLDLTDHEVRDAEATAMATIKDVMGLPLESFGVA